ncbi:hypothetical protein B0H66DRAFT_274210 [Apodospora peruviana]|uniref:Fungal N-terminal domain-containing protein n=1 Tax=Apodospora peruviana TaxID=516989 RepID=A0AAE0M1N6_9PEZI|nr:hypothetical protein B0H66DRAFT_274210 [Apodospora peruviana]
MSFGFGIGPGDIALFTGFAIKVVKALRDEGGAKTEFQIAERQCQGFLDVINELNRLDLSGIPEAFRGKMDEYSAEIVSIVGDYRKTVERYEKSMGASTDRGWLSSAPRKVQWALTAAQDLAAFRQSLSAQLDLVKLAIQASILQLVAAQANTQASSSALALTGMHHRGRAAQSPRLSLSWDSNPMRDRLFYRRLDYMTDLVYERLLTRSGVPLADRGRVRRTPDHTDLDLIQPQLPAIAEEEGTPIIPVERDQESRDDVNSGVAVAGETGHSGTSDLADDLNEYLRELNLDPLSGEEAEIANGAGSQGQDGNNIGGEDADEFFGSPSMAGQPGPKEPELTHRLLMFVSASSRFVSHVNQAWDSVPGEPEELRNLSRRLMQYSTLVEAVTQTVGIAMSKTSSLVELGWAILGESNDVLEEINEIISGLLPDQIFWGQPASKRSRIFAAVKWRFRKSRTLVVTEKMESLKSTLSIMVQLHEVQIRLAEHFNHCHHHNVSASAEERVVGRQIPWR